MLVRRREVQPYRVPITNQMPETVGYIKGVLVEMQETSKV